MRSEAPNPSGNNHLPHGLPPVAPPSGRFIAQLFLVPGLIVAVAVVIYLGSSYLVRSAHAPEQFLRNLDNPNPEIRWRAAHDLAQVLKRPESLALASDPKFALDLADRLESALAKLEQDEWALRAQIDKTEQTSGTLTEAKRAALWQELKEQRNHVLYLTSCLGDFTVPAGAALLGEVALQEKGAEIKGLTLRRRRAVWTLANLGDNFKRRYLGINAQPDDKVLDEKDKSAIVAALEKEASGSPGKRAEWARLALQHVQRKAGVDVILERCAGADDPYLRELTAHALNFWDGELVVPTLLKLARDDGRGQRIEIYEID